MTRARHLLPLAAAVLVLGASSLAFELLVPGWGSAGAIIGGFVMLLAAGRHWKDLLWRKLEQQRVALAEVRALIELQDPRFSPPLPWTGWTLPPTGIRAVLQTLDLNHATTVVDCGCGLSTIYVAQALQALGRGRVIALEHDQRWADFIEDLIERHELQDRVEVHCTPLTEREFYGEQSIWYSLPEPPLADGEKIDIMLIDGPPGALGPRARLGAVPFFWPHLAADAVVFLDDARRPDESRIIDTWCEHHDLRTTPIASEHGMMKLVRRPAADRDASKRKS